MIQTSNYLLPDGKTVLCHVWTCDTDAKTYEAKVKHISGIYRDLPLNEGIRRYAIARFTLFHDVDFDGRFVTWTYIDRRRSV